MTRRTREELLHLADAVLAEVADGDAEVTVLDEEQSLTRFAENGIHQNVATQSLSRRVRLLRDGRTGVAEWRGEGEHVAADLVRRAEEERRLTPASPRPVPLPEPDGGSDEPAAFGPDTADCPPERRADAVAVIARAAAARGLQAFGAVETTHTQHVVVNTRGVRRHAPATHAGIITVVRGDDGAGYADRHSASFDALDPDAVAAEVVERCERNQGAHALEPGSYEVVLAPYAVAEMVEFLGLLGFSALAMQEGRSFMRPGERLMSEAVSIRDDARDPSHHPFPFDWEGVTRRRVDLVTEGVCGDAVHDTATALTGGAASTGHALPQPNTTGPLPMHLVMDGGHVDVDGLVRAVGRGLLVTRLWYVRVVHPLRTVITGMTREGTFLIENGRIGPPVRDLRFTQSIVDALADVRGVSRETALEIGDWGMATRVPWLHLGHFAFTS